MLGLNGYVDFVLSKLGDFVSFFGQSEFTNGRVQFCGPGPRSIGGSRGERRCL